MRATVTLLLTLAVAGCGGGSSPVAVAPTPVLTASAPPVVPYHRPQPTLAASTAAATVSTPSSAPVVASTSSRPDPRVSSAPTVAKATPSPSPHPSTTPAGSVHAMTMTAPYMFSPTTLTIAVGDSVKVTNADSTRHTFTDSGVFDSGDLGQGSSYTYRFAKVGTFNFLCSYHSAVGMRGTVTVR